jgi:hypothetical protein
MGQFSAEKPVAPPWRPGQLSVEINTRGSHSPANTRRERRGSGLCLLRPPSGSATSRGSREGIATRLVIIRPQF